MSKVRVYEVAKQLNMDQKALVALFQSMGFGDVRNHMSSVEADAVERVRRHLDRQKSPDVAEQRIRPTVVKRRARVADAPAAAAQEVPESHPGLTALEETPAPAVEAAPAVMEAHEPEPVSVRSTEPSVPPPASAPVESWPVAVDHAPQVHEPASSPEPMAASAPPPSAAAPVEPAVQQPRVAAPRTGIDVWQGRPGVPMPAARTSAPPARRTTYDTRSVGGPQGPRSRGPMGTRGGPQRGGMRSRAPGAIRASNTQEMGAHKKVIKIDEEVSLQQLAAKMSLKSTDVLMRLLGMGMPGVHINSTLDSDTAKILAGEFGWTVEDVAVSEEDSIVAAQGAAEEATDEMEARPPIVTVMGHVDHGKTSLLDRIRSADVASGEAGGITQHIGAYRVHTKRGCIAFLDTPGHEAFTAMRARGASLTDLVVLVVAADDGVMPQTKEAAAQAKSAGVPIIVAINKIDKPGADQERIKRDLSALGLAPEEWGGDTLFCPISAKTGEGVDALLDSIILQAEVLDLRAAPTRRASGIVIESLLDRGRGPVARIMVQDGTLRAGDVVLAGAAWGKVRAMTDEHGRTCLEAGPATPVEVLGLNEVPQAGDPVHCVKDTKTAEQIALTRRSKSKSLIPQDSRVSLEALSNRLAEGDKLELKVVLKADVQGSVEALAQALSKLTSSKVKLTIVHAGVGGITEGDVNLAVAAKAIIVGFNVRPAGKASSHAENEGIDIRLYNIIYNAIDELRNAMEGLLPATRVERVIGRAEIRQIFRVAKVGAVGGSMVVNGVIKRGVDARLLRGGAIVWAGKVTGLRRFKDDVREVQEGMECGISLGEFQDFKELDIVEAFEIEEIKAKLED